ncbi:hypothetical protein BGZ51_008147 [Haplosporangium sp. Z 767]|nr:hypothetical protein BGZ50_007681 [Haplosporangium sp. Z 11]KAF9190862.1 hypothetical protein BGZ51_008147 [Haplosporangium sp. Z 767]
MHLRNGGSEATTTNNTSSLKHLHRANSSKSFTKGVIYEETSGLLAKKKNLGSILQPIQVKHRMEQWVKKYREMVILISQAGQGDNDDGLTLKDKVTQKLDRYYELEERFSTYKGNEAIETVEAGAVDELQILVLKEEGDSWE